jgi:hypothetical protein
VAVTSICIGSSVDQTNAFFGLLDEVKVYLEPALEHARDFDGDGILDVVDNCPGTANYGQADGNGDRVGDACTDRTGTPCPDATACDDGNPCTTDACANGTCSCAPATGECNDFDPFTSQDKCTDGQCAGVRSDLTVTARRA